MLRFFSRKVRLLLRVSFLATFAESMLVPMYAAFTEKVGGSILDAGIAYAARRGDLHTARPQDSSTPPSLPASLNRGG